MRPLSIFGTLKQHCTKLMNRSIIFLRLFYFLSPGNIRRMKMVWSSHFMACCKWSVWVLARQKKETRLNYSVLGSISASRPRLLCVLQQPTMSFFERVAGLRRPTVMRIVGLLKERSLCPIVAICNVNRRQIWKARIKLTDFVSPSVVEGIRAHFEFSSLD